jgi:hypothetical protein
MKALSVRQPWAGLIAGGFKTIETRTWQTHYRGELLICASQTRVKNISLHHYRDPLCYALGSTVCVVNLVDCVPMELKHEEAAMCRIYPGAWAWILEDVQKVKQIPVKGQLSIYELPHLAIENLRL